MDWKEIWLSIFGTAEWLGLNMGFWISMGVVAMLVVIMNVVFWSMKPAEGGDKGKKPEKNKSR